MRLQTLNLSLIIFNPKPYPKSYREGCDCNALILIVVSWIIK